MKYLVMECHLSYAIVLDEEGRFLHAANRNYQVGQTVENVIELQPVQTKSQKPKKNRWLAGIAAMAACMALIVTTMLPQTPYASVYMTINPQVRLDVDRKDNVLEVEGVNKDGRDLLEGYEHQKKALELVMDELVDRAMDMGYLHPGGQITLTLDGEDVRWVETRGQELETHLTTYLTEKIQVTIEVEQGAAPPQETAKPGPDSTDPSVEVVIPITPPSADSNYGDSDYGTTTENGSSDYDTIDGDSGYEEPTDGDSNYDDPSATNYEPDGESDYEVPEQTPNESDSSYELPEQPDDDGMTDYGSVSGSDGSDDDADDESISDYDSDGNEDDTEAESDYDAE